MYFSDDDKDIVESKKAYSSYVQDTIKRAEKKAEKNNVFSLIFLGNHYLNKRKEDYDFKKGFEYLKRAYDLGSEDATFFIAYHYFMGIGVEKDYDTAIDYLLKSYKTSNIYKVSACYLLSYIYLLSEDHFNFEKGVGYIKDLIDSSLSEIKDYTATINNEDYRNEKEFAYAYDNALKANERRNTILKVMNEIESHTLTTKTPFTEEFLTISPLSNAVQIYIDLTYDATSDDKKKGYDHLKKQIDGFILNYEFEQGMNDIPDYVDPHIKSKGNPLLPYGFILSQDETQKFIQECKDKAKYNIPESVLMLALGYLGKFNYFPIDIPLAKEYLYQLRSLQVPEGNLYLAKIFHDGLDSNIVDKEKAICFLKEVQDQKSLASLLLGYYALIDEQDCQKATSYLLRYIDEECNQDDAITKNFKVGNDIDLLNQDEMVQYIESIEKAMRLVFDGKAAYEKKDYEQAKTLFDQVAREYKLTQAAIFMAVLYLNGQGVEQDFAKAKEIIEEVLALDF